MTPKPPGTRLPGTTLPRRNQGRDGLLDPIAVDENFRAVERQLRRIPQIQSDRPPEVELILGQEYQAGVLVGTMTVTVRDVGENFEGYVRFAVVEGDAEFDHSDPTDLAVWNVTDSTLPYATTVDLQAKHGGLIAVAVPYRTFSEPDVIKWVIRQHRFDEDFEAELTGHELAFDTNGYPLLSLTGDEDVAKHYVKMTVGDDIAAATPGDPSASSKDATLSARTGKLRFDGTGGVADKQAAMGKIVGFKVVCENGAGIVNAQVFGPYFQRRGDSKTVKPAVQVTAIRSGSTVTVLLTISDPTLAITAIEFREQDGGGSLGGSFVSTWDATSGTIGSSTALTRSEDVSSAPGLAAKLIWRVTYTDENGASQYLGDEIDVSHLEAVTKTLRFSNNVAGPAFDTSSWEQFMQYTQPGLVAVTLDLTGAIPVPRGVAITSISARLYRNAVGDQAELLFYRVDDSGTTSLRATLTHSSTGWQTVTASLSESGSDTSTYDYAILVELTATVAKDDARFRWVELSYNAPSYDKTY